MMRWWYPALAAAAFFAGRAWPIQEPDRHWMARDGADWRRMGEQEQSAYVDGFLAGAALGQAAPGAADSAELTEAMARLRRSDELRFPYGSNVYASRISDFYWWENHRSLPTWYAFWEVNAILTRPK
jgi:hypothetical protein